MLLSGILSRPPSMLWSLPPDVDVPLPLIDEVEPVVAGGSALGLDVLAAGSPVMDPRPLGLPCAKATEWLLSRTLKIIATSFMELVLSSSLLKNLEMERFVILSGRCWGGAVELDAIF